MNWSSLTYHCRMTSNPIMILCVIGWLSLGCEDDRSSQDPLSDVMRMDQSMTIDMMTDLMIDTSVDASVDASVDVDMMALEPIVGWLSLTVNPSRTYYVLSDQPVVSVDAFDVFGDRIISPELSYRIDPPELGSPLVNETLRLTPDQFTRETTVSIAFDREGEGRLIVCAVDPQTSELTDVCAERSLIVDEGLPAIHVFWPQRGAQLAANDRWPEWADVVDDIVEPDELFQGMLGEIPPTLLDFIPVYGQVDEGRGDVTVFLNQEEVSVDDQGRFSALLEAKPGFIELSIIADDGVRVTPSIDRRWILFAHRYGSVEDQGVDIDNGLSFALHQRAIDQDQPVMAGEPPQLNEVAQLVSLLLTSADPGVFLGAGVIAQETGIDISIDEISLGEPEVDILITHQGLAMQLELNEVSAYISGEVNLADSLIDLNGWVDLDVGAFVEYRIEVIDGTLKLVYQAGAVALSDLEPRLNSAAANALLTALESTARTLIVEQFESQLLSALQDELPALLEESADSVLGALSYFELPIDTGFVGVDPLPITLEVQPTSVQNIPSSFVRLSAKLMIKRESIGDPEADGGDLEQLRGYPQLYFSEVDPPVSDSLSILLRVDVVNALFTEIWRGGLLNFSPPLPASAEFFYSGASLQASAPPIIRRGDQGSSYPLYLEIGALDLSLTQSATDLSDHYEVFIRVGANVEVDNLELVASLGDIPEVEVSLYQLANERPAISEQLIVNIIQQQLWPQLRDALVSQLRLPVPQSPLYLNTLGELGVELPSSQLRLDLREDARYFGPWIEVGGTLNISIE